MNTSKSKPWFDRNPKVTFISLLIIGILLIDFIVATFFIPYDYNSFRCPDPNFHHGLHPDKAVKNKWGDKVFKVYTNSLGFKDETCKLVPLQSQKKRILFMGDSFTEGVGMSWEDSFVGILDKATPDTEILNAGVVSYSPKLYYLKLKYLLETISVKFDEVYILIDNSDIMDEITYRDFKPYPQNSLKKFGHKLRSYFYSNSYIYYSISSYINKNNRNAIAKSWNPFSGESIVDESALQDDSFIEATLDWSFTTIKYERWGKEGLNLAAQNMKNVIELCNSNDLTIKIVIYPWPNLIKRNDLNNIQVRFWGDFCLQNNVQLLNLFPYFIIGRNPAETINTYFIPGDVHWNEQGNKYVAELLLNFLSTQNNMQEE